MTAPPNRVDMPAEYARAGIEHFWRVENLTDEPADLALFRYRLDREGGGYVLLEAHKGKMTVPTPVALRLDLAGLL